MKWKIVFLVVLLVLVAFSGGIWLSLPRFSIDNTSSLKKFHVSTIWGNVFLWKSGYLSQVNKVKVIYTDVVQKGYSITSRDGTEILSMWVENQNKNVTISIQYDKSSFSELSKRERGFDKDVYLGICLALEGKSIGWIGCQKKITEYTDWASSKKIHGPVTGIKLFSFQLVSQAYAACYGTIICGKEEWNCRCSKSTSIDCSIYPCPLKDETYVWASRCNLETGSNLNCLSIGDANRCENQSTAAQCAVGCNTSADTYCTWMSQPGTAPPPASGGSCSVSGIANENVNCNAYGLNEEKWENNNLTSEGYSCGPNATSPSSMCGWWQGRWNGYFTAPETGWYQFLIKAFPSGGMAIDLNKDGSLYTDYWNQRRAG